MNKTTTRRRTQSAVQTPLETYLREINETSLLSADDEQAAEQKTDGKSK